MKLILEIDTHKYKLPQMELLTGAETSAAERKRKQRAKEKTKNVTLSHPSHKLVTTEKENKSEELEKDTDTEKDILENWLDDKSKEADNPHTYKAKMRRLINVHDKDALEEFDTWRNEQSKIKEKKKRIAQQEKFTRVVDEFDYSPLKKLDGKPIQNVISDKGTSYLHINFEDGSHMSVPKEQIYLSITQGGTTHESI